MWYFFFFIRIIWIRAWRESMTKRLATSENTDRDIEIQLECSEKIPMKNKADVV